MSDLPACPKCNSAYTYENGSLLICPECFYEWNLNEQQDDRIIADELNKVLIQMAMSFTMAIR
jgi:protein PhnA